MDQRINPLVAGVPPRETSDRAEVLKNGFALAGNEDKRECRTVRAYGTVVMWSTYDTCLRYVR